MISLEYACALLSTPSLGCNHWSKFRETRGDEHGKLHLSRKNTKTSISRTLLSQLFLKYACTVDVMIHQYVHTKFSNSTLLILLNFLKTILSMNLIQLHSRFLQSNVFSKVWKNRKSAIRRFCVEHTDESKRPPYRHILKTVVKVVEEKF